MRIATQLALFLENRPGTLARVCDALGEAAINIFAISTIDTVDHTVVRMVVDNPRTAIFRLEERGTLVVECDVLLIDAINHPGALAAIAHRLAADSINIEYVYAAIHPDAARGCMVLRVSDARKALKILQQERPHIARSKPRPAARARAKKARA